MSGTEGVPDDETSGTESVPIVDAVKSVNTSNRSCGTIEPASQCLADSPSDESEGGNNASDLLVENYQGSTILDISEQESNQIMDAIMSLDNSYAQEGINHNRYEKESSNYKQFAKAEHMLKAIRDVFPDVKIHKYHQKALLEEVQIPLDDGTTEPAGVSLEQLHRGNRLFRHNYLPARLRAYESMVERGVVPKNKVVSQLIKSLKKFKRKLGEGADPAKDPAFVGWRIWFKENKAAYGIVDQKAPEELEGAVDTYVEPDWVGREHNLTEEQLKAIKF
ncbi:MAG: hypothetical protein AAFQ07_13740 [Chloroflexota bacterium]